MQPRFDRRWHRAALAGRRDAIDRLAQAALGPLYRFCFWRVGGNRHLCEDVVQETMVRAIRDLEHFDPDRGRGEIFPWLAGLARNEIQRAVAREKTAANLQTLWEKMDDELRRIYAALESEPVDDELLGREETRQMVGATMSQLPPRYRDALEAKYVAGRTVREMAAAGKLSEKAVESQLTRARKAFRATFLALAANLGLEGNM